MNTKSLLLAHITIGEKKQIFIIQQNFNANMAPPNNFSFLQFQFEVKLY